jgi:TonB-dependent receptor
MHYTFIRLLPAPLVALGAGLALAFVTGPAHAQSAAGTATGRVTIHATGSLLEGASVRIPELGREALTTREGQYTLTGLPPGEHVLLISYEGLDAVRVPVVISPGASVRRDATLRTEVFALDSVIVAARVEGQAAAINLQRNAPTLRTVVSADALGQIREGNIGDALVRLPGVSVETRAGVQRTATIRGLAPQYNSVTVDGLRMTNVDGNRDIALDSYPANFLSRVEVAKAQLPDLPADAIGGTVNLITPSAYDIEGRVLQLQAGTTYNDLRGNWNKQAAITFSDTFGGGKEFGLLGSVAYFRDERGYDVVESAFNVSATDQFILNRALYYDRYEVKDKVAAGLAFDYRPGGATTLFAKAIYHYDYRDLNHLGTDWRPNPATATNLSADGATTTGGRVDSFMFYREPKNVFQMYVLGGTHRAGDWTLDARGAFSKAKKDYPVTLQVLNSFNNVNLTYDRRVRDFPTFRVDNGVNVNDPAGLAFRQFTTSQVPRVEEEWSFDASAQRAFTGGRVPWSVRTGARLTLKDSAQAQPLTARFSGLTGATAASLLETYSNPDFMRESGGRAQLLNFFPDWRRYLAVQGGTGGTLTATAADRFFTDSTIVNADFAIGEDIASAYAMATADLGALRLMAGVRAEKTEIESTANRIVTSGNTVVNVTRVRGASDYTNVLPGLHARYLALGDRLVLRAAVTQAISRPPPGDLVPSVQENAQLNQRIIGNENLKPAESLNLDAGAEYYLPRLGVVSAGLFYKDIKNFVFSSSRIAPDGVDERTRTNGDGGQVLGAEFVWSQQFTFLPGPLSGLGLEANYTVLDSEGSYPGRGSDLPFINSPDFIFNGILAYTRGPLGLRLSFNQLPERLESVGARAALDRYNAAVQIWDFAVKYRIARAHTLFLNVKNLTDEPTVQFQGSRGNPVAVTYYGTQFNFGIDFSF